MSKSKPTYRVTLQDAEGNFSTDIVEKNPPKKGETFEYEHREVRVGHVTKVEEIDSDGNVTVLTELGDLHHALEEPESGDEIPTPAELSNDPPLEPVQ